MIRKDIIKSICSILLIIFSYNTCNSQSFFNSIKDIFGKSTEEKKTTKSSKQNEDVFELTIEENLNNPHLGKYSFPIITFQKEQVKYLKKNNKYKTELIREGEVVKITLSSASLFNANDTVLMSNSVGLLQPLLKYLVIPDLYRMVLVMHTDNTGTDSYTYNLSRARVESVLQWIESKNVCTDYVIPYALGGSDPIVPNNSMANRLMNRRIEIYLVPGKTMIDQVKNGTITLK